MQFLGGDAGIFAKVCIHPGAGALPPLMRLGGAMHAILQWVALTQLQECTHHPPHALFGGDACVFAKHCIDPGTGGLSPLRPQFLGATHAFLQRVASTWLQEDSHPLMQVLG